MTRDTARAPAAVLRMGAGVLAVLVLASCSGGAQPSARRPPAEPAGTASSGGTAASPDPSPLTSKTSSTPSEPMDPATPATSSGPLSRSSFPRPRRLGARWSYAVEPGDTEGGNLGNGIPALERNPSEVRLAAVPMGCPRQHRLPRPSHALEVDYIRARAKVVAIRARFRGPGEAREFFDRRADTITGCQGRSGGPAVGTLIDTVSRASSGVLLSDRTPRSDPWTELAVLDGPAVVLLAAHGRVDDPPLNRTDVGSLVTAFRG